MYALALIILWVGVAIAAVLIAICFIPLALVVGYLLITNKKRFW